MASETVIVPNVNGVPRAAKTPRLTSSTSGAMPALQGVTSLWVEAMPTNGASMSASLSPMARIIERWGALMTPSVVSHERCLPSARLVFVVMISACQIYFSPRVIVAPRRSRTTWTRRVAGSVARNSRSTVSGQRSQSIGSVMWIHIGWSPTG